MQPASSHEVSEISATEAQRFYRQFRLKGEQVAFSLNGKFFACFHNGEIVGIASAFRMGESTRIKSLMVRKHFRGRGYGAALLQHLVYPGIRYTAFATVYSRGLFQRFGFVEKSIKPNGISYMVKESK